MSRQHDAATNRSVYWRIFEKIFVFATESCRRNMTQKKSNQTEFVRLAATTKILLQIQRFSQKFSSTHEAICHSDVSSQCVVATSRPICAHGVICRRDA